MLDWLPWLGLSIAAILLPIVAVLLYRMLRDGPSQNPRKSTPQFIATTSDETMVISRRDADDMLNK